MELRWWSQEFNDHYRNRRGGQGSGFGNDHQGSGSGYGSGHAIAYGVDFGSANLRNDGGRDGKHYIIKWFINTSNYNY